MRRILAVLIFATLAACGGDSPTAPADPRVAVAGTYQLQQVNGGALPVTYFQNTAGRIEFVSGAITLRADGSFTERLTLRTTYFNGTAPSTTDIPENGTFTVTGSTITFNVPPSSEGSGFSWTGAVSGGALTYTYDNASYRFVK